jgi:hypothetical protein
MDINVSEEFVVSIFRVQIALGAESYSENRI